MNYDGDISDLLKTDDIPTLMYWRIVLTYFDDHKDSLSLEQLELLENESERCRIYWNSEKNFVERYTKNGKQVEQKVVKPGLGITKDEVGPKIYDYVEQRRIQEQEK